MGIGIIVKRWNAVMHSKIMGSMNIKMMGRKEY